MKATHPIEAKVQNPEEIEELFDEISYGKGASILRMIEGYIGKDNFRKGVSTYLQQFRYSNASGRDLWDHLQKASGAEVSRIMEACRYSNASGRDLWDHLQKASGAEVSRIMEAWIGKAGYPVVTASMKGGKLLL